MSTSCRTIIECKGTRSSSSLAFTERLVDAPETMVTSPSGRSLRSLSSRLYWLRLVLVSPDPDVRLREVNGERRIELRFFRCIPMLSNGAIVGRQIRRSMYLAADQEHARMRKILSHTFSPEALRTQEPLLQKPVRELMQEVDHERLNNEGIVDLEKWYTWIAFDMIGDTSFGEPFNCVLEPDHRSWPLMLSRVRKVITGLSGLKSIAPSFSLLQWLLPGSILQKSVLQHVVNRLAFDLDQVKNRIASKPSRGDVLSSIVNQNYENGSLDDTEIMANASLFILAGTETVATLLSAVTYFLTQDPGALSNLTVEIRENFKDESLLTVQNLAHTPYLNACIEEAMRLIPPVPEGLPRVTPPEGEHICGQWVPGGVSSAFLSEDNFPLIAL